MKKLLKKPASSPPKKIIKPTAATKPSKPLKKKATVADKQPEKPVVKKALKKAEPPEKKITSGPMPEVPKGYKWKGKLDPMSARDEVKRFYRIKPEDMPPMFPKLNPIVPDNTVWRMNTLTGKTNALVTVMPDGVNVAWASCAICMNHVDRCICKNGIVMPKSIEWIYIRSKMSMDGIPTEGRSNAQASDVTARALYWYKTKESGRTFSSSSAARTPVQTRTPASTRPAATKAAEQPSVAPRRLSKSKGKAAPAVDVSNLDMSKLNKDAASRSKDMTAEVTKALGGGKKSLKKKPDNNINIKKLKKGK